MAKKIKFKFTIEERLRRSVTIDAENEREAREIVLKKYGDGDIVLNADDFCNYGIYFQGVEYGTDNDEIIAKKSSKK